MEKILVSACLLGTPCRYDGKSKPNLGVIELKSKYHIIPVCPEQMGGLSTPRLPSEICGETVKRIDGVDVTAQYKKGALEVLRIAQENGCSKAILKAKSPACSSSLVYDGTFTNTLVSGLGICARLLIENGIKVVDEEHLTDL